MSILASLFDIVNDPSILGLTAAESSAESMIYQKPIALFEVDDEMAVGHFLTSTDNKLLSLQILFALRHKSLVS